MEIKSNVAFDFEQLETLAGLNEYCVNQVLNDTEVLRDPLYEFAIFHRKYTEKEHKKEEKARENAQEAFRNAMAQTLATEVTRQQLIEGKNPMELLELLFSPQTNRNQIKQISKESKKLTLRFSKVFYLC